MKYVSVLLSFIFICSLVSCGGDDYRYDKEGSNECIRVWSMGADYEANIEQSNEFRTIWNSLKWKENADPSRYNYMFFDGNISIYYDSGNGIFYDITNNKHAILSDEINAKVISIIKELTLIQSKGDVIN